MTLPPPPPLNDSAGSYATSSGGSEYTLARHASWLQRVGGALVDAIPSIVLSVIGRAGAALYVICGLLNLAYFIWNYCYRQGRTGQTIGKQMLKIKLVKEGTGEPIGGWTCFGRTFVHILDVLPIFLGYLWPLWDAKKQTFADKLMSTVVVEI